MFEQDKPKTRFSLAEFYFKKLKIVNLTIMKCHLDRLLLEVITKIKQSKCKERSFVTIKKQRSSGGGGGGGGRMLKLLRVRSLLLIFVTHTFC